MQLFFDKLLSSIIQIILFSIIPFIFWLVFNQSKESFFSWIGFKKIKSGHKASALLMTLLGTAGFMFISILVLYLIKGTKTATSDFSDMGVKAIPAALVYAFLNTALPEEILFRGFLLKRLQNKLRFPLANTIQSILFGALHGVMFFTSTGVFKSAVIIIFTAMIAWFMGYVNEKKANGSLYPSILAHGFSNTISALFSIFSLF